MVSLYNDFCQYLISKKKTSANTLASYKRDVKSFIVFLQTKKIDSFVSVDSNIIDAYIKFLKKNGKSPATISRSLSSLRCLFKYLISKKIVEFNPMLSVKSTTKKENALPEIMSSKDIDVLLNSPNLKTPKGIRDKAMLEVMYATGIRVSELLNIKLGDINTDVGYIIVNRSTGKERAIPLYPMASEAINNYLTNARDTFAFDKTNNFLFLNNQGSEMTRQGFWKIIKQYASDTDIDAAITPKILRHSFATHLLENGADIHVIKDMLGHTALASTKVYTKVLKNKYLSVYENCHPRAKRF